MAKISIIIPVYKVEKYINQCLDSIINQTMKDIEIICINDGSPDKSSDIIKQYQETDSRIKLINQENQGQAVARNKGLEITNGKYIMFVDPDDWLELDACEILYNQITKYNNDIVMFDYTNHVEETSQYKKSAYLRPYTGYTDLNHIKIREWKRNFFVAGYIWTIIYNKDFLDKNNIRFPILKSSEDILFVIKSLLLSEDASIVKKSLYNYRHRKTSSRSDESFIENMFEGRNLVLDYIIESNLPQNIIKYWVQYCCRAYLHWYYCEFYTDKQKRLRLKNLIAEQLDYLSQFDFRAKILQLLLLMHITTFYYKIIRPIGKYCIVLPYRKFKSKRRKNNDTN